MQWKHKHMNIRQKLSCEFREDRIIQFTVSAYPNKVRSFTQIFDRESEASGPKSLIVVLVVLVPILFYFEWFSMKKY